MSQIILYATLSGFSLILGAIIALKFKLSQKVVAFFMAFGSGVLICALTFGLMQQSFEHGGFDAVIIGFLLGGLVFIGSDYLMHRSGLKKHRKLNFLKVKFDQNPTGELITLGAILDGVPESIALGIALFNSHATGLLMLVAIFISNLPEGFSSTAGLLKEGFKKSKILLGWLAVGITLALIAIISFVFLHDLDPNTIGIIEAFAAGSILAMLADSMMPEAFDEGGFEIALATILGFLLAFIISRA